jgi:exonuclease SbcC
LQLKSVRVHHIRSYVDATVRLGPGTTLLTGDVGAGKTSLLYAIEMALFGFAEVEPAYLVRHRTREAEVALCLSEGPKTYEFRRRFRRRFSRGKESYEVEECSLAIDGSRTTYSATELRQRAIDLLGFPDNPNPRAHSDVWRWAVYIPQERMRDVLSQTAEERLATARKALGIEQYRTAADNAQELSAELRRIAVLYESEAEGLRHWAEDLPRARTLSAELARELGELGSEEERGRAAEAAARAALEAAEAERIERERDVRESGRLEAERTARAREIARLASEIERAARERDRLSSEDARRQRELDGRATPADELARLRASRGGLEEELRAAEGALTGFLQADAQVEGADRALAELLPARERLEEEARGVEEQLAAALAERPLKEPPAPTPRTLAEIGEEIRTLRGSAEEATAAAARARQVAGELDELLRLGTCPRCHQRVAPDDHRAHLEESREAARAAETRRDELRAGLERLEAERGARERYERAREKFEQVETRRRQLRERSESVTARRIELDRAEAERRAEKERAAEERARFAPVVEQRTRRQADRARLDLEIARLEGLQAELERMRRERAEATERRIALEVEVARLETERGALERRQAEAAEELAAIRARQEISRAREGVLTRARSEAERCRAEIERTVARIAAARSAIEEATRRAHEAEEGVRRRDERLAEAARARTLAGWVGREFREGLLELEKRRLAQAQTEFNGAFARYFQTLLEDPTMLARIDLAFSPSVEIDGEPTPADALSGGERTALALAFRLAMGRVVRSAGRLKIDTLVLDEPTDGFSPEQVSRMSELLEEIEVPQVLLVSHESELAGVADRVITVRKEAGRSLIVTGEARGASEDAAGAAAPEPASVPRRGRARSARPRPLTEGSDGTPPVPTAAAPPPEGSR